MAAKKVDTREVLAALRESELINLDLPVSRLTDSVGKLEEVAGYVLAWEKYVFIVGDVADIAVNPAIDQ